MKCVEKYDANGEGASWTISDMLIDHHNLLWNINFLKFLWLSTKFQISLTNSKIPWLFPDLEFPWPVATLDREGLLSNWLSLRADEMLRGNTYLVKIVQWIYKNLDNGLQSCEKVKIYL